jgi:hypothetical protein
MDSGLPSAAPFHIERAGKTSITSDKAVAAAIR